MEQSPLAGVLVGRQLRIDTPTNWNPCFHVFGALDVRTGEWVSRFLDHWTGKVFIALLKHLVAV